MNPSALVQWLDEQTEEFCRFVGKGKKKTKTKKKVKAAYESAKKAPLGSGKRFATLVKKGMSKELAAWIGRKKHGKKKFQALAKAGK